MIPADVVSRVAKARMLAEKAAAERALRERGGEEWVFAVDAATGEWYPRAQHLLESFGMLDNLGLQMKKCSCRSGT